MALTPPNQSYALPFAAYDAGGNPVDLGYSEGIAVVSTGGFWSAKVKVPTGVSYVTVGAVGLSQLTYAAADTSYTIDTTFSAPFYQATLDQLGIKDPHFPLIGKIKILPDQMDLSVFMPTRAAQRRAKKNPGMTPAAAAAALLADLQSGAIPSIAMAPGDLLGKLTGSASAVFSCGLSTGDAAPLSFVFGKIARAAPDLMVPAVQAFPWLTDQKNVSFLDLVMTPDSNGAVASPNGTGTVTCSYDDAAHTSLALAFVAGTRRFILPVPAGARTATLSITSIGSPVPVQLTSASGGAPVQNPPNPCVFPLPADLTQSVAIVLGQPGPAELYTIQLSSEYAETSMVPDINPQPFTMGVTSYPPIEMDALPPFKVPALVVTYDEVTLLPGPGVRDFDVTLTLDPPVAGVQWSLDSATRPQSGTLTNVTAAEATFSSPDVGGVYLFDIAIPTQRAQLVLCLPLAGGEVKDIVQADLARTDTFVTTALFRYSPGEIIAYAFDWFWIGGRGDYLGRPDNPASPTFRRLNMMDDGRGAVATWYGVPVRMAKVTDFIFSYACHKLGISDFLQDISHGCGTFDDASTAACYDAGEQVCNGADYVTTCSALAPNIWGTGDPKNQLLWPNPNPATNHVLSPKLVTNLREQFVSPGFINYFD